MADCGDSQHCKLYHHLKQQQNSPVTAHYKIHIIEIANNFYHLLQNTCHEILKSASLSYISDNFYDPTIIAAVNLENKLN
jgi:hypothetical protein